MRVFLRFGRRLREILVLKLGDLGVGIFLDVIELGRGGTVDFVFIIRIR